MRYGKPLAVKQKRYAFWMFAVNNKAGSPLNNVNKPSTSDPKTGGEFQNCFILDATRP